MSVGIAPSKNARLIKMYNKRIRRCRICEKEIKVTIKRIGAVSKNPKLKTSQQITSDEGVYFEISSKGIMKSQGVWFCNDCWKKILKFKK